MFAANQAVTIASVLQYPSSAGPDAGNRVKAVLFDCFGVVYNDAVLDFLDSHKIDYCSPDAPYRELAHKSDTGDVSLDAFFNELSRLTLQEPRLVRPELLDVSRLNQELVKYIKQLKRHYRIGMLSDAPKGFLDPFLVNQGPRKLFDVVVVSSEVGYTKPSPEIFSIVANRFGVAFPEIAFIDNSANNVRAALELGMVGIIYQNNQQIMHDLQQML